MTPGERNEPHRNRRASPRVWRDHDWYVLTRLKAAIERALDREAVLARGQRVIDLGCGDRPYAALFETRGATYIACDVEGDVDVRIEPGHPLALPDASADGVVSFQVLEHVWDLDWYLGECHRLLASNGWLLLSTHGTWLYHPHPTDFRRWTRDGLTEELSTRGFVVEEVQSVAGPLAWTTLFRLIAIHRALGRVPVLGPLLTPLPTVAMNARMVLEDAITPAGLRETNASVYVVLARKRA
jgi:SAM-dependent methyltransferase